MMMYFFCKVKYIYCEAFDHHKDMDGCMEQVLYSN